MKKLIVCCFLLILHACVPVPTIPLGEEKTGGLVDFEDRTNGQDCAGPELAFKCTLWNLLRNNSCVNCHGKPNHIQFTNEDYQKAFEATLLSGKVNLLEPETSRIIFKIKDDKHNCGTDANCEDIAGRILTEIQRWAERGGTGDAQIGAFQTSSVPFPAPTDTLNYGRKGQTEHGTIILEAEQSAPGVVSGRFNPIITSSASGHYYLGDTGFEENPIAPNAERRGSFQTTGCEVPTQEDLNDPVNGTFRIREDGTYINSNTRRGPANQIVKDGYRPYHQQVRSFFIRPDRRVEYAKTILAGNSPDVTRVLLSNSGFTTPSQGQKLGVEAGNQRADGGNDSFLIMRILPHFVQYDEVFNPDGTRKTTGSYTKDDGSTESLYRLFSSASYAPNMNIIRSKFNSNESWKKDFIYPNLKKAVQALHYINLTNFTEKGRSGKKPYMRVVGMDPMAYLAQSDISISYQCPTTGPFAGPDEFYEGQDQIDDPRFYTCNPNDPTYPGFETLLEYHVTDTRNTLAPLTYDNALTRMTVINDEIVEYDPGNSIHVATGWFHKIDAYVYLYVDPGAVIIDDPNFTSVAYEGETGAFKNDEVFTVKEEKVFNIASNSQNLDLTAFFSGSTAGLSPEDKLENFQATLYPVLQSARCATCHGDTGAQVRFAQSDALASLGILESINAVNFADPGGSFRPRDGNGSSVIVHNCQNNGDPRFDCANDATLRSTFINAINNWKSENEADNTGTDVRALSMKERTPGRTIHTFNVTQAGNYNLWFKLRGLADASDTFSYRIKNSSGAVVQSRTYSGNSPNNDQVACHINNEGASMEWRWRTPGRAAEHINLDPNGVRLKDEEGDFLNIPNNRRYFNLGVGSYTLEVFQNGMNPLIDAFALNHIPSMADEDRLLFQPDLIKGHESHVSDYNRHVLRYDLRNLIEIQEDEEAFFEIEVKLVFGGQSYAFRNPRFIFNNNRNKKLKVKEIKGLINGRHQVTDQTYKSIEGIVGKNRVLTYASLVSLVQGSTPADVRFAFAFEELDVVDSDYSDIDPRGPGPKGLAERECLELELFSKTVKPILKNLRLVLDGDLEEFIERYPGSAGRPSNSVDTYQCMTCHNENHPYFKMTTFDYNDDLLCKQAIARVDFEAYANSLVVRGINQSNGHPKFRMIESFSFADTNVKRELKTHNGTTDHLDGYAPYLIDDETTLATKYIDGIFAVNTPARMGITLPNDFATRSSNGKMNFYNSLSAENKDKVDFIGKLMAVRYVNLPNYANRFEIGGYNDQVHRELLGGRRGEGDIVDPQHIPDYTTTEEERNAGGFVPKEERNPLYLDRDDAGRAMYYNPSESSYENNPTSSEGMNGLGSILVHINKNGSNKISGNKVYDYKTLTPGVQSDINEMYVEMEAARNAARQAVLNWIRKEDEAAKAP